MTLNSKHISLIVMCLIQGCASTTEKEKDILRKPFFGIEASDTLQLVAPNIVSSNLAEYNGTFSPDGTEFYYTVSFPGRSVIAFMKLNPDNAWSTPAIAKFSGEHSEFDPILSPDGSRLFFTSYRPVNDSSKGGRTNIWYVDREGDDWGSPQFIALTENGDYYSSATTSGTIYFNSWKTGDIYKAVKKDSTYSIERLPDTINSDKAEGDPFISPNEDYLIFRGYGREVSFGAGDLYISFNIDNQWTTPENLGDVINSSEDEICPLVTADGKLFIFSSNKFREDFKTGALEPLESYKERFKTFDNGAYNIYCISADFIEKLRKQHQ
jgi:Tol biopolymer transport system component